MITSTVAGGGNLGFPAIGDGGLATSAVLNVPVGVAVDATRILISDAADQRIRKVDLTSNIITTICGNGTAGFAGDGDRDANAMLNSPGLIFFNGTNLVIADTGNNRIRQIVTAIDINTSSLSLSAKLNFSIDPKTGDTINGKDSVALKAGLSFPAGINPANLIVGVDIIDLHQQVQFDATGKQPALGKAAKPGVTPPFNFTLPAPPPHARQQVLAGAEDDVGGGSEAGGVCVFERRDIPRRTRARGFFEHHDGQRRSDFTGAHQHHAGIDDVYGIGDDGV